MNTSSSTIFSINRRILLRRAIASFCLCWVLGVTLSAQTSLEFWPEIDGYVRLNDRLRLLMLSALSKGRESDVQTLDMAASLDISIKPIARKKFMTEDWERSRFLWVRLGYDRVFKQVNDSITTPENRGMINIYTKAPLPADIWLEGRTRVDLRWIGDTFSTRYRFRLEATREFNVLNHNVVPYLNAEVFYDTRYHGWSRILIMAGSEFTVSKLFRFEIYCAPQLDYLPERNNLIGLGIAAKFYL